MINSILLGVFVALVVGALANVVGITFSTKLGLFSIPSARRRHNRPIPLSGGLWMYLGFMCGLLFVCLREPGWAAQEMPGLWRVALGMTAMIVLGFLDDRKSVKVSQKFLAQAAVCSLMFGIPQIAEFVSSFRPIFGLTIYPLTLVFMTGVVNAVNFLDGADGLLGTLLMVMFGALAARTADFNHPSLSGMISMLLLPAIASFLFFNWRPAKIFMGDAGSLTLGLALIICSFSIGSEGQGHWHGDWCDALGGVTQLGYPICDLLWVITKRLRRGFSPFRADQNHLHHFLMRLGFSVPGCVFVIGLLNVCLQIASYQVVTQPLTVSWPCLTVTAVACFLFALWIVTVDRWKNRELSKAAIFGRTRQAKSTGASEFMLLIYVKPLFEGQTFDSSEQASAAIESLGFLVESNSPRGTQLYWYAAKKAVCLMYPAGSVSPTDILGLQSRIQRLVDGWVEMFNVSISAPSLRVVLPSPGELDPAERQAVLRPLQRSSSEKLAA